MVSLKTSTGSVAIWVVIGVLVATGIGSYGVNMYKLVQCDFESPYASEVIHGAGVIIPPVSLVTAWFDTDGTE